MVNVSRPIYLDHNATTPIDSCVLEAMMPFLTGSFGNPSSIEHEHGHEAAVAVDRAREQVASVIGAQTSEIVFTGSCTEANNLAILGVARGAPKKGHIITSQIEHPAVLEPVRALEREGWRVTYLPVCDQGLVSPDSVAEAISTDTVLVSVMGANNEVGTVQPIRKIGTICTERGVLFHSDLAQCVAYENFDVKRDGLHLASLSAHKAYGPKGVGALYVRSRNPRVRVAPIMFGGGQERGIRSGTLNVAGIVGMGMACAIARKSGAQEGARLRKMSSTFLGIVQNAFPNARLNGHPTLRLANSLSISIDGVEPLALIRKLRGQISFSASSACATSKVQTSPVLMAMFGDTARARQAFRISSGRDTNETEYLEAARAIVEAANELQRAAA
ncbi:cysteine desulfurase family protein [Rhizomicrobium electricum]|uniref:cysteine desulfurase family protein n=1 Tax=Rhizomicrobium electricum TaxID=480070 RepID=UPI001ABB76C4|nr:aminotransferase class V-fold PLP-dependent enzyme [Rhizomicrobium electricum]NIJ50362.1 cysteine desulfurase [Rhizomicrobium electricum]